MCRLPADCHVAASSHGYLLHGMCVAYADSSLLRANVSAKIEERLGMKQQILSGDQFAAYEPMMKLLSRCLKIGDAIHSIAGTRGAAMERPKQSQEPSSKMQNLNFPF